MEHLLNPERTVEAVLCHVANPEGRLLLLLKAKGKFGGGFWNAPGGKLEVGEDAESAARREVLEETGLTVRELQRAGRLEFYFGSGKSQPDWRVHVFRCSSFSGELAPAPNSSGEAEALRWFATEEIPYESMWADDRYWLPIFLRGKRFFGSFEYTAEARKLVRASVREGD